MQPGQRTIVKHLARALSPTERLIVILFFVDRLRCSEIADVLQLPTVDVDRALKAIRQLAINGLWLWKRV